ncbi:MAG: CinA family protein [Candidatus Poseidoniales archaeon]|nr:CinA family protein [Candidatus Poseidoniales archaeon]|tara:strand:- start:5621 stop:6322 length:702 start_codon:yes stop_codon:yes gene_type:complete
MGEGDVVEEIAALASRLSRRLRKRGWSIVTAESCTGGLLASTFTDISGASNWFEQGWVVYNNDAKMRELGVERSAFDSGKAGAVSHQVALQMARGARHRSDALVSIAITGIAGPSGATATKEVGLVHVAVTAGAQFIVRRRDFGENDRLDNKRTFVAFALRLALEALDRVQADEARLAAVENRSEVPPKIDTSHMDPKSEQWEGSLTWAPNETKTVAEEIQKVDLASLTDWDE